VEALVVVLALLLLGLAAGRWGVSSLDGPESPEWARRRSWRGFTPIRR
jgi:hypothetical protein